MYLKKEQAVAKLEDYKREMELQELSERTTHKYLADISHGWKKYRMILFQWKL